MKKKQTVFYGVVLHDWSLSGPVLDSLFVNEADALARADAVEVEIEKNKEEAAGVGVIKIDILKAK